MGLGGEGGRAPEKLDGFPNTACRLGTPGDLEGPGRQGFGNAVGGESLQEEAEDRGNSE